jgi:hypothetical protein
VKRIPFIPGDLHQISHTIHLAGTEAGEVVIIIRIEVIIIIRIGAAAAAVEVVVIIIVGGMEEEEINRIVVDATVNQENN